MKKRTVVGLHSCKEAIKVRPQSIQQVYLDESKKKQWENDSVLNSKTLKNKLKFVKKSVLDKWSSGHQGIAIDLQTDEPHLDWEKLKTKDKAIVLVLDEVEDPTNLGNIMRTSWLLNADAILVPKNRTAPLTPHACKIASGAAEHIPILQVHPLPQTLEELKESGFWVYGLDAQADQDLYQVKFGHKVVLIAGNEGKGLRKTTLNSCDQLVKIPQTQDSASLNVATSLAISLSHVCREHYSTK